MYDDVIDDVMRMGSPLTTNQSSHHKQMFTDDDDSDIDMQCIAYNL